MLCILGEVAAALLDELHVLALVRLVQGLPGSHRGAAPMHLQRPHCSSARTTLRPIIDCTPGKQTGQRAWLADQASGTLNL